MKNNMKLFNELSKAAQQKAAKYFEPKVGYKLIGNPYVTDVAAEVADYIEKSAMEYCFSESGNFICACRK